MRPLTTGAGSVTDRVDSRKQVAARDLSQFTGTMDDATGLIQNGRAVADLSDKELVQLAPHHLDAFAEIVRRHQDFVYGAAMRIVRNPTIAEDVAQDTFVRAFRAIDGFRGDAAVRSWLYTISTNLAKNVVTRRREYPSESMPETPSTSRPEREVVTGEMSEQLQRAIAELPPDLRGPLVMREYENKSYEEIAELTGLRLNTVRTRIHRAKKALGKAMEDWR